MDWLNQHGRQHGQPASEGLKPTIPRNPPCNRGASELSLQMMADTARGRCFYVGIKKSVALLLLLGPGEVRQPDFSRQV